MAKKETLQKLKSEYEKVYETPLNWCPLLGYIPSFEEAPILQNNRMFEIWDKYQSIIEIARWHYFNIRFAYSQKYIASPEISNLTLPILFHDHRDEILLCRYKNREKEFKAIRRLFQNLDYLIIKTSCDTRAVSLCRTIKTNAQGIPYKPIGRVKNGLQDDFSIVAEQNKITREPPREFWPKTSLEDVKKAYTDALHGGLDFFDIFLWEARKITGPEARLNHQKIFALLAILEAWLALTSLLFEPRQCEHMDTLFKIQKKLFYPEELLDFAKSYENKEKKKAKGERAKKASKQRISIKEVFQKAIDKLKEKNPRKNVDDLYKFIFKNHCVDEDSILRFCGNDTNVVNKFHKIEVGMDEYYLYCMPDIVVPDDPFKACLCLIKNKDYETKCKPRTFDTYRSEYFYKRKLKGDKAK